MKIIPAIDLIDGKCVRLTKGDYSTQKVYSENPLELARQFEAAGIQHLHLVDLDGAKSKHIVNHDILESICTHTNLTVDFGGGIKSDEDIRIAFESGANQVTGGSIALKDPETFKRWIAVYGPSKIILGADCKGRKIATSGWLETSEVDIIPYIKNYQSEGIKTVICTDIAKDGMLQGPSVELYKEILEKTQVNLIASGGVTTLDDLLILQSMGCYGAIIGKAIYEGNITLQQLKELC